MSSETVQSTPLPPAAAQWLARARAEWQQRQFDAAERSIRQALALAPDDADALRMLGVMAQHRGDQATAADCFRRVLPVWPEDAELRVGLGIALTYWRPYWSLYASHILTPAILAIAYGSLVASSGPVSSESSRIGCGASFG